MSLFINFGFGLGFSGFAGVSGTGPPADPDGRLTLGGNALVLDGRFLILD